MQNVWHKTSLENNILGVDLDIVAMINTGYGVPSMYLSCHHHIYIYMIYPWEDVGYGSMDMGK